jgi:O-antigen/teichoic acid export membrane protein
MADERPPTQSTEDVARTAGRGVLFIATAKIYFMLAGAAIEFVLPRILGRFLFGAYGFVAQTVSNFNNVMVTGTIQAVSRYTTEDPDRADEVKAAGLWMHLLVGVPLALLFAAGASLWAREFAHDPTKAAPLRLAAAIIAAYAFYAVFVGSANGLRAFHKQAGLDMTFATLRAGGVLGGAAVSLAVWGAIAGWVAASVAILVIAAVWVVGVPRGLGRVPWARLRPMILFLGGVAAYLIVLNLIMSVDQFLLKRLSTEWYRLHQGLDAAAAAHQADGQVGYYRAVQNLARLPYQLMIAVTFVIFPLVSRSTFTQDHAQTRSYIRTTLRYSLIFAGAMGAVLAANPTPILDIPYAPDFAVEGGPALAVLALGNVAFAIFTIAGTILNGSGRWIEALIVGLITLGAAAAALVIGIPARAPGQPMLLACALATSGAMLLGAVASLGLLWWRFRAALPALTLLRVALATGAAMGLGRVLPTHGAITTAGMALVHGVVFLGVLVVTRELGKADVAAVARVTGRKR